jgi:hypothetical protein
MLILIVLQILLLNLKILMQVKKVSYRTCLDWIICQINLMDDLMVLCDTYVFPVIGRVWNQFDAFP